MTYLQNNLGILKVEKPVYFRLYGHFLGSTRLTASWNANLYGHGGGGVLKQF